MTKTTMTNINLDTRRRKIIYRAWHRGIREMDLVLGQYVDAHIANMTDAQLDELEHIMSFEDRDLLTWVTGEVATPKDVDTPMYRDMLEYRTKVDLFAKDNFS